MAGLYPDHHKLQKKDKTRKKRKMSSKKDMIQPDQAKTKKTHVRRQSIYSGKPNFSNDEDSFEVRDDLYIQR
ncbi:hypothetical protein F2P79_025893 [Pimephales promelas]|nr:hypothetical protein F2P79_025893 [Pimephales promelas]KAG1924847.1 hypothetical protein F2P79_025893 [Pimephales promelas]